MQRDFIFYVRTSFLLMLTLTLLRLDPRTDRPGEVREVGDFFFSEKDFGFGPPGFTQITHTCHPQPLPRETVSLPLP